MMKPSMGVDAIQALQLAMKRIGARLESLCSPDTPLRWLGEASMTGGFD